MPTTRQPPTPSPFSGSRIYTVASSVFYAGEAPVEAEEEPVEVPTTRNNDSYRILEDVAVEAAAQVPNYDAVDLVIRRRFPEIVESFARSSTSPPSHMFNEIVERIRQHITTPIGICQRCGLLGEPRTYCGCGHVFASIDDRPIREQLRTYNYRIAQDFPAKNTKTEKPPHMYLGVELEVKSKVGVNTNFPTRIEREILPEFAIVKRDGSLGESSFEINSVPATLKYHVAGVWDKFFDEAPKFVKGELSGHGMHIHVTRGVISPLTIGKFLVFMNADNNADLVVKLAGRSEDHFCKPKKDHKLKDPLENSYCNNSQRYARVNTCNNHTLEIRMFQSTTNKRRFFANLEFVHAAIKFCSVAGMRHLTTEYFTKWLLKRRSDYPNLCDFLSCLNYIPAEGDKPKTAHFKE